MACQRFLLTLVRDFAACFQLSSHDLDSPVTLVSTLTYSCQSNSAIIAITGGCWKRSRQSRRCLQLTSRYIICRYKGGTWTATQSTMKVRIVLCEVAPNIRACLLTGQLTPHRVQRRLYLLLRPALADRVVSLACIVVLDLR